MLQAAVCTILDLLSEFCSSVIGNGGIETSAKSILFRLSTIIGLFNCEGGEQEDRISSRVSLRGELAP